MAFVNTVPFWPRKTERQICLPGPSKGMLVLTQSPELIVGRKGERLVQKVTDSVCVQNPALRAMLLDYPDLSPSLQARLPYSQLFPGESCNEKAELVVMQPNATWVRFWERPLTRLQALATALSGVDESEPATWSVLELLVEQGDTELRSVALDFAATLTEKILGGLKVAEMARMICSDDAPHTVCDHFPGNWPGFLAQHLIPNGIHVDAVRFVDAVGA